MNKVYLFGIGFDNLTISQAVSLIIDKAKESERQFVVTPNVDHVVTFFKDRQFKEIYEHADLVLADGMPIILASRIFRKPLREKISGSDIFPLICGEAAKNNLKVFLLGGLPGVADKARENLVRQYPGINITGTYSPPFGFEKDEKENEKILGMLTEERPDILFVGLGAPKQEKWIYAHIDKMNVPVSLGVGASFDFAANTVNRAPVWMQRFCLEWFYRFLQEPSRMFKRYFIRDSFFLYILVTEFLKSWRSL